MQYAWSADGLLLAIAESVDNTTNVRILDLAGNEKVSLSHSGFMAPLSWSPDGRFVVTTFTTPKNTTAVLVIAADGSEQNSFPSVESGGYLELSGWLPSGELLIMKSKAVSSGELLALDLDAESSRPLTDVRVVPDFFGRPALSPDKKTLAMLGQAGAEVPCQGGSPTVLFTVDIVTGAGRHLTQSPGCGTGGIVWSPDGAQIAFSSLSDPDRYGLFTVDVISGETERRTTGFHNVVAWPEAGTIVANEYVCVQCGDGNEPRVLAIDAQTGGVTELSDYAPNAVSQRGEIVIAEGAVFKLITSTGTNLATVGQVEPGWVYYGLQWAQSREYVAYQRLREQGDHYFQVNGDGSDLGLVGSYANYARLSPNLQRIAYVQYEQDAGLVHARLWLADADGTNAQQVQAEGNWLDGLVARQLPPDLQRGHDPQRRERRVYRASGRQRSSPCRDGKRRHLLEERASHLGAQR